MEAYDTQASKSSEELKTTLQRKYKLDKAAPSGVVSVSGKQIGYRRKDGYWILSHGGKQQLAHRVVWMLHYGEIPDGLVIDHIDRNPSNNLIENLRCVPQSVNLTNVDVRPHCKSGEKFISTCGRTGRFVVRIKRKSHGTYGTLEEAIEVRNRF